MGKKWKKCDEYKLGLEKIGLLEKLGNNREKTNIFATLL